MDFTYDPKTEQLIVANATRIEYHQIDIWLTRNPKGYRFTPAFKAGYWNGKDSVFNNGAINQGLWKECLNACNVIGAKFNITNKSDFPINREVTIESVREFCMDFFKNHKIKKDGNWVPFMPYDHQIDTAFKILKNRFCLAEVATSGGKSLIVSIVYFYTLAKLDENARLLLIVPSISLVTQFFDEIIDYNIGENVDFDGGNPNKLNISIEEIMSEKPRKHSNTENPNICIGTYQSLVNYPKEFFIDFHSVACDEAHTCKSKSLKTILSKTFTHAYNRFGVSGTFPVDESMEVLYIQALLGPKVSNVEAQTLVKAGIITQMDIKVLMLNHNDKEFNDKVAYIKRAGGGKEAYLIEKEYIHVSDKRLDFMKKIIDKCNNNTLVLFHTIEYGERIYEKMKKEMPEKEFYYIDGNISGKNREIIKKNMELSGGKVKVLVASFGTLSTGVSIKNLFNVIFADSFKSEQIIIQSIGRILRLFTGKDTAYVFDLVDVFEKDPRNIFYNQYLERKKFYMKRNYPFKELKINL
jgi:superfamily II DNA or RNA helicase